MFPSNFSNTATPNNAHFNYRSYRPCILNKVQNTDGTTFSYEFDSWIEEENWTLIPPGIVISSSNEAKNGLTFKAMTTVKQKIADITDSDMTTPLDGMTAVTIPAGLSELPGVTAATTMPLIMIFRPDGQLHEHIIFALQEGTIVDGAVVDTQAAGQRVYYPIFINKRSGKITYFEPLSKAE